MSRKLMNSRPCLDHFQGQFLRNLGQSCDSISKKDHKTFKAN